MPAPPKPLPNITNLDRPYWQAAKRHKLRLQKCLDCGHVRYPASPVCDRCGSNRYEWSKMSGRGKIASWVVFHRCYFPSFAEEIPYNVAMIELEEGPMVISNIVGLDHRSLFRGMRVEVIFDDVTEEITIPRFRMIKEEPVHAV
ncbi:MAG: Zn-ribbon domain-containing OB-fold protein [Deltaproteobacteria bacterium]|nr:Zn-ribbon domain-containing OB-fold protein [Deltaproteobacteria bacterium]